MRPAAISLLLGLLLVVTVRSDLENKASDKDNPNVNPAEEYPTNRSDDKYSGDDWSPPDTLEAATAGLIAELTKHGLSGASPFALLLNPEADMWETSERRSPLVSVPLAQAETVARAAASAAWQSPAFRKVRDAFAPCHKSEADLSTCIRESVVGILDRAGHSRELRILGGAITLRATGENSVEDAEDTEDVGDLPEDARARDDRLDEIIAKKLTDLAASRVLTLRFPPQAVESVKNGIEEFRGKKGKGLLPLFLMMALMMKGMLTTLAMGTIAMIAGKALTVGLIALVISGVIGLKKLASQGGGGYEVVNVAASPHHHGRHLSPQPLHLDPYRAHAPSLAAGDSR